jgi:hypothetical protein
MIDEVRNFNSSIDSCQIKTRKNNWRFPSRVFAGVVKGLQTIEVMQGFIFS